MSETLTEYEQLQAHAALVARRILRTGEFVLTRDMEQLARAWSLQAGEEIRANERLAAAQSDLARLAKSNAAQAAEVERLRDVVRVVLAAHTDQQQVGRAARIEAALLVARRALSNEEAK